MRPDEGSHFEQLLLAERGRLSDVLTRLRSAAPVETADRDRAPGAERDAGATGVGPEDDAAVATRALAALEEVDEALRLLYETPAQYGLCRTCGQPIPTGRLEVVPATRYCGRHVRGP